jgi:hypothetical protein
MKPILANRLNSILRTHITPMRSSLSGILTVAFKSLVYYALVYPSFLFCLKL